MIETVIFDIGNVLVDFCWEKHFKSKGSDRTEAGSACRCHSEKSDLVFV